MYSLLIKIAGGIMNHSISLEIPEHLMDKIEELLEVSEANINDLLLKFICQRLKQIETREHKQKKAKKKDYRYRSYKDWSQNKDTRFWDAHTLFGQILMKHVYKRWVEALPKDATMREMQIAEETADQIMIALAVLLDNDKSIDHKEIFGDLQKDFIISTDLVVYDTDEHGDYQGNDEVFEISRSSLSKGLSYYIGDWLMDDFSEWG